MTNCRICAEDEELRFGVCFECASAAELRAAKRTVLQHVVKSIVHLWHRDRISSYFAITWAWQRLTGTGDYAVGGTFDTEYPGWRK